jgi:hypothetical protein
MIVDQDSVFSRRAFICTQETSDSTERGSGGQHRRNLISAITASAAISAIRDRIVFQSPDDPISRSPD